jgi:hypothetical protein
VHNEVPRLSPDRSHRHTAGGPVRIIRAARRPRLVSTTLRTLAVTAVCLVVVAGPVPVRAGATVNLDQWASTALKWQNGDLNGNNSRYPEGGVVPFRLAIEGLSAGSHQIHINYDFTAGGHKAYDFLATWNLTNASGKICAPSGGGISSMCPSLGVSSTATFPSDPFRADGLPVSGAETYSGAPRRLTLWGGTIVSITGPVHSGSISGNSSADFLVRFRSTGAAVLLAWGGHLAQSAYWNRAAGGPADGASQVSGAPWHMRTLQLDGSGNKNQDRSIQPSAIVGALPPFALAPSPTPTPRPQSRPAPTPRAPAPTAASRTSPGPGSPSGPGRAHPTVPPTATAEPVRGSTSDSSPVIVAGLAALMLVATVSGTRRRRRGDRDRS